MLNDGKLNGKQMVIEEYVKAAVSKHIHNDTLAICSFCMQVYAEGNTE